MNMRDTTAQINLKSLLGLIPRSKDPLSSLYEGITNALEAISQRRQKYGGEVDGIIEVKLYFTSLLEETNELERIEILDNGIGFDEENYDRFVTLLDKSKGYNNRGSGRIQYLHSASKIEINSFYNKNNKTYKRHFICDSTNYIADASEEIDTNNSPTGSTVIFTGFAHNSKKIKYFDNIKIKDLKNIIKNKFLLRLYLDKEKFSVPTIKIVFFKKDLEIGTEIIKSEDIPAPLMSGDFKVPYVKIKDGKSDSIEWVPVSEKSEQLQWAHFKLSKNELEQNGVFLCSKDVLVKKLPFDEIHKTDSVDGYRFLTVIYGKILDDENFVNHAVDDFKFPHQKDAEKIIKEELRFDPEEDFLFFDNIQKEFYKIIPSIYSDILDLQKLQKKNIETIAKAHGIPLEIALSAQIRLTDAEQEITDKIYRQQAEKLSKENQKIKTLYESLNQLNPTDDNYQDELEKRSTELLTLIPEQNKEELSRYVIRREMVTKVLKLVLESGLTYQEHTTKEKDKTPRPRKDKEGLIHDLIFKRKDKSTNGLNDLWILNEEYVHFEGCSDLPLNQIKDAKNNNLLRSISETDLIKYGVKLERRPDIFLNAEEGKCILIELKEPSTDLSNHLHQMIKYCNVIANFSLQKIEKFYCYLVGENINRIDLDGDYIRNVNGDFVKTNLPINCYEEGKQDITIASAQIEVIKLSSIYIRAQRRNKSFADKLGISISLEEN